MHIRTILAALLSNLLASTAAHDTLPGAIARRDEPTPTVTAVPPPGAATVTTATGTAGTTTAPWTPTRKSDHKHPPWMKTTADALAMSAYNADMHSLHNRIKTDPLFTSMKNALKTGIPQSYRDAMSTNPASLRREYHTTPPPWYTSLPANVREFMEANQRAAKSIWDKDLGPSATPPGAAARRSEAGDVGAALGWVLVAAVGVAALLV